MFVIFASKMIFFFLLMDGDVVGFMIVPLLKIFNKALRGCITPNPWRMALIFWIRLDVLNKISRIDAGVSDGLASSNCATTELTMGAAKEVPSTCI